MQRRDPRHPSEPPRDNPAGRTCRKEYSLNNQIPSLSLASRRPPSTSPHSRPLVRHRCQVPRTSNLVQKPQWQQPSIFKHLPALPLPVPEITACPSTTQQPVEFRDSLHSNSLRSLNERTTKPLEAEGCSAIKRATFQLNNHCFGLLVLTLSNYLTVIFSNHWTLP